MRNTGKKYGRLFRLITAAVILALMSVFMSFRTGAENNNTAVSYPLETARPSVNGKLHVEGVCLADENNEPVQLRGVSTHGLTWYPQYITGEFFGNISQDWNCNMIRLAMYSEIYCEQKEESLKMLKKGIDAAIAADMYVLVDWHILADYDPNMNKAQAAEFFAQISAEYASYPNLIFEICNEPNGETDWSDVIRYCNDIIPVIRANMPEAVIVVGTPEYDRNLAGAVVRPLDFDNVMYVLHFYTASHHEGLRAELEAAVESGLPVFISECGLSEAPGDGRVDFQSAVEWFTYLKKHHISYAVWSLSDKDETSAFFVPGFKPEKIPEDSDLTLTGKWVRELIRGAEPEDIPMAAPVVEKTGTSKLKSWLSNSLGSYGYHAIGQWYKFALAALAVTFAGVLGHGLYRKKSAGRRRTYDDLYESETKHDAGALLKARIILAVSTCCTLIYLMWRIFLSVPTEAGYLPVFCNLVLLAVEILGFIESMILYENLMNMREHPLPEIGDDEYPDVDIFISTYNEPTDLLRKTINGCVHMRYPDPGKVHIWLCDDNRRSEMRQLAMDMGVGYFDRPDNKGAKAGNLNHAMSLTGAPYIVTFDADMIPKSDFLLKTIPYFVDVEKRQKDLPEAERLHLGLLQTPQCFYDPDVFQHALYSEKRAPNEQDFFYRTIEPARTSTNSVIYGGSNTILSRQALEAIGGFYTGSITEDFATGMLIEEAGFISLGLPEPLASGQTPHAYRDHIKQRTRWGRGCISTARQLKFMHRKGLNLLQKINYWSSVIYWYSPIKNLIYILSPLIYAVFTIPVFRCTWPELIVFWLPMYYMQDTCLRVLSRKTISLKWSGIYETSVMPHMLVPVIREGLGISETSFKVTDKSAAARKRQTDVKAMMPFLILIVLSVAGIVRLFVFMDSVQFISILILLFWLVRNLYFLIMSVFLVDGRDSDAEVVRVTDAEPVIVTIAHGTDKGHVFEGVTTLLTEHKIRVYLDDGNLLKNGTSVDVALAYNALQLQLKGTVTNVHESRNRNVCTQEIEILDFCGNEMEYLQVLYDRIPTLPQALTNDFGILMHLWQNIAHRVARTRQ